MPGKSAAEGKSLLAPQHSFYFQSIHALPLENRVFPAPEQIQQFTYISNRRAGIDIWPTPAVADHPLVPHIQNMLRSLPKPIYRLASRYLTGIFLVDQTLGSARTEALWDSSSRLAGSYMVLNVNALARPANAWAGMRENSAYYSRGNVTIEVVLEPPATDTPESAVRFIFLHELGHVLGMNLGVHGHWAIPETKPLTLRSPFTQISWRSDENSGLISPEKRSFPLLKQLRFYRFETAALPRAVAPLVYRQLVFTGFPSLYGVLSPYEDFAETFALYVHTRILGKPYAVIIRDGGRVIGIYQSCLQTGSCPAKAVFVKHLLERNTD